MRKVEGEVPGFLIIISLSSSAVFANIIYLTN
jgi:hypothetical protein